MVDRIRGDHFGVPVVNFIDATYADTSGVNIDKTTKHQKSVNSSKTPRTMTALPPADVKDIT